MSDYSEVVSEVEQEDSERGAIEDASSLPDKEAETTHTWTDEKGADHTIPAESLKKLFQDSGEYKKWVGKQQKKGEKLNTRETELNDRETKMQQSLNDFEAKKKKLEQSGGSFSQISGKYKDMKEDAYMEQSKSYMMKNYPDYDHERLEEFIDRFDDTNVLHKLYLLHMAERGENMENIIHEEKIKLVRQAKGKKGLPASGSRATSEDDTIPDDKDAFKRKVRNKFLGSIGQ